MNSLVQRSDVGEFRRRYRWMVLFVVTCFLILVGRLVELQLIEGDLHHAQARRNIINEVPLPTARGVIRDAFGKVIAANRPSYNVYIHPSNIDLEKTFSRVVQLMSIDEAHAKELKAKILQIRAEPGTRKEQQTLLRADVDRDVVAALETHEAELKGVDVVPVPVRYYPFGELAAHLIGYMREVDSETLARMEGLGYRSGDKLGAIGIERRWESYLRGQRGQRKVLRGPRRQNREELENKYLEEPRVLQAVPGRDISLTLDVELVAAIERAMRGQLSGAVVVIDVRTGRLLAALSKPSFDPNLVSAGGDSSVVRETFRRLYSDPLNPTLDKTMTAAYPPGSTFKPFSALAALAERLLDPKAQVDCHGGIEYGRRYFRCTGVHRNVDLHEAIVRSCNTYFYDLGERIHIDKLAKIGVDFGFGFKTGIGINPEARGRMPTRGWYARRDRGTFYGGHSLLASIGQGASSTTVLQLALAYAALANGGTLYQPQVVRSIETSDGTVVQEFPPRVRRMIEMDPEHLALINDALIGVVNDSEGTAYKERYEGVDMAGKTGTAQVSHVTPRGVDPDKVWYFNRDHAWFTGYAPSHSPEIAIAVIIEHGGVGGKNAVPVAMRVVRDWQKLKEKRLSARASAASRPDSKRSAL